MLLLDTGARRAELADLQLVHVDLDMLLVLGKGRRERALPGTGPVRPLSATSASAPVTSMPSSPHCRSALHKHAQLPSL
jgi:hypothetical protein